MFYLITKAFLIIYTDVHLLQNNISIKMSMSSLSSFIVPFFSFKLSQTWSGRKPLFAFIETLLCFRIFAPPSSPSILVALGSVSVRVFALVQHVPIRSESLGVTLQSVHVRHLASHHKYPLIQCDDWFEEKNFHPKHNYVWYHGVHLPKKNPRTPLSNFSNTPESWLFSIIGHQIDSIEDRHILHCQTDEPNPDTKWNLHFKAVWY